MKNMWLSLTLCGLLTAGFPAHAKADSLRAYLMAGFTWIGVSVAADLLIHKTKIFSEIEKAIFGSDREAVGGILAGTLGTWAAISVFKHYK